MRLTVAPRGSDKPTEGGVSLNEDRLVSFFAKEVKRLNIANEAALATAIDGMTDAQFGAFMRGLLKAWITRAA